ncbi:DUF5305 domain-containing protein [Halomicroarcula sp. F13]|uniref:DUF5305 domain-containing protein n=1 Tax=Haloarcula rubra TaxID=2487747 RepID=A0AAW4PKK3_9EURY|nr:DUF5305 domain-containing protein [Halomicroarcula rubra]MBX0321591.1 DUF5305 domain-containing protein [Halomicroarcula rubra]
MNRRWLRVRALLESQFELLVVVLLALALAGGWVTYGAYVDPGTTTEERVVSSWGTTGDYDHAATVVEPNPIYDVGTTLENQSLYVAAVAPELDGTFRFGYNATDGGNLDVTVAEHLVVHSVAEEDDATVEVWRQVRSLDEQSVDSVRPNRTVRVPFTVDVNRTMNRTERIEERLGDPPGTPQMAVVATVRLNGTVNGGEVNRTMEYVLPVAFDRGAYRVNATAATQRFETTETVVVPREPGQAETLGGPAALALGLLGLVALGAARWRNDLALTDAERERLAFEDDREEFDEWINAIELPSDAESLPRAEASSLGDLVDFAIDTDNSVVERPDDGAYYVIHDGYAYSYAPPEIDGASPDDRPTTPTDGSTMEASGAEASSTETDGTDGER